MSETQRHPGEYPRHLGRREALGRLAQLSIAVATAGCTPLRYALHLYPDTFDGTDAGDRVLSAFARTVIPGLPEDDANIFRAFKDPELPFHSFAGFFAADLDGRARRMFRRGFADLAQGSRTEVVAAGLNAGGRTHQLYAGAVFLAQLSCYAGIYDAGAGCPLIHFDGAYEFRGVRATTFPDASRFLARALTDDGNPA